MIQDPQLDGPDATIPATEATIAIRTNRRRPVKKAAPKSPRPNHYKVICISLYTKDLEDLTAKVAELKRRGKTKMSKSEIIRLALAKLNLDEVA
jgi:hypothetical protein